MAVGTVGTANVAAGSSVISMQSVANIAAGQTVSGTGIGAGTVVTSVSGSNIAVSVPATAIITGGSKLSFGSNAASASSSESYRLSFNGFLRTQYASLGCAGVIDDDGVFADSGGSGKWRVDLGSASADGVHPSAALHQAAVNAGLIASRMFTPQ